MGKAGGVVVIFFGVVLNLIGLATFFGMLVDNTIMIIAGPILILCFLIFAAGTFLMYKGVQMYNRPKHIPTYDEYMKKYHKNDDEKSAV